MGRQASKIISPARYPLIRPLHGYDRLCEIQTHLTITLKPVQQKKKSMTHQPNERMCFFGDQGVLRGCLAKFFCKLGMWFFGDHPAKKKKKGFTHFFWRPNSRTWLWPRWQVRDSLSKMHSQCTWCFHYVILSVWSHLINEISILSSDARMYLHTYFTCTCIPDAWTIQKLQ